MRNSSIYLKARLSYNLLTFRRSLPLSLESTLNSSVVEWPLGKVTVPVRSRCFNSYFLRCNIIFKIIPLEISFNKIRFIRQLYNLYDLNWTYKSRNGSQFFFIKQWDILYHTSAVIFINFSLYVVTFSSYIARWSTGYVYYSRKLCNYLSFTVI